MNIHDRQARGIPISIGFDILIFSCPETYKRNQHLFKLKICILHSFYVYLGVQSYICIKILHLFCKLIKLVIRDTFKHAANFLNPYF